MRMIFCAAIVFTVLGCSGGKPVSTPASFDPNDLEKTLRWLNDLSNSVYEGGEPGNELSNKLAQEEKEKKLMEDARKLFPPLVGQEVKWSFTVSRVLEERGEFYVNFGAPLWALQTPVFLLPTDSAKPPQTADELGQYQTRLDAPGGLDIGWTLHVGSVISQEDAAKLKEGDKVIVNGKLASILWDRPYFAVFVSDAKATVQPR